VAVRHIQSVYDLIIVKNQAYQLHFLTNPFPQRLPALLSILQLNICADEVNAICMDIGTYQVKAGYAGEDTPKYVFPSAIGRISDGSNMMDTDGDDANANKNNVKGFFVGTQSLNIRRDNMEITSPFGEHGVLSDWDAVEALWSHAFKDQMRINPEGHPIMMAEPTHNSKAAREKAVELLFEKYKAPAVFLAKNSVLSSFAVGRQTSLVVDCGHNGTTGE